ncbi:MAG: hypothetical protein ACQETV_03915, partial [Actinomycetota bacterium]
MPTAHDDAGARRPTRPSVLRLAAATLLAALAVAVASGATSARADVDPEPPSVTSTVAVTVEVRDRHGGPVADAEVVAEGDGETVTDGTEPRTFEVTGAPDDAVIFDAHSERGRAEETLTLEALEEREGSVTLEVVPDAWGTVVGPDGEGVGGVDVLGWRDGDPLDEPPAAWTASEADGGWELHRGSRGEDPLAVVAVGASVEA